jgi:hypothetical protein
MAPQRTNSVSLSPTPGETERWETSSAVFRYAALLLIADDLQCGRLGVMSFGVSRDTLPKRCWFVCTGVRTASVRAVAVSSSIKRIFSPGTPRISSKDTGHIAFARSRHQFDTSIAGVTLRDR